MAKDGGKQPSVASFFSPKASAVASPNKAPVAATRNDAASATGKLGKRAIGGEKGLEKGKDTLAKKKRKVEVLVLSDSDNEDAGAAPPPTASTSPAPPPKLVSLDTKPTLHPATPTKALAFFPGLGGPAASATKATPPSRPTKSLDTSIFSFEPKRDVDTTAWLKGRVPFAVLVDAFVQVSSTKSRLVILRVLVNLLRVVIELDPESLLGRSVS